jgi:hypothetical protein
LLDWIRQKCNAIFLHPTVIPSWAQIPLSKMTHTLDAQKRWCAFPPPGQQRALFTDGPNRGCAGMLPPGGHVEPSPPHSNCSWGDLEAMFKRNWVGHGYLFDGSSGWQDVSTF